MSIGVVLVVLGGIASLATVLSWLGVAPNGPHILAGIKAQIRVRLDAPRDVLALRKLTEGLVGMVQDQVVSLAALDERAHSLSDRLTTITGQVAEVLNRTSVVDGSIECLRHDGIRLSDRVNVLVEEIKELRDAGASTKRSLYDLERGLANLGERITETGNQHGVKIDGLEKRLGSLEQGRAAHPARRGTFFDFATGGGNGDAPAGAPPPDPDPPPADAPSSRPRAPGFGDHRVGPGLGVLLARLLVGAEEQRPRAGVHRGEAAELQAATGETVELAYVDHGYTGEASHGCSGAWPRTRRREAARGQAWLRLVAEVLGGGTRFRLSLLLPPPGPR